ncbi:MAG: DoxX family protein [Chitinophagales bacterium]
MTTIQQISLYAMAFFYAGAGINHFINPKFYLSIMPKFFPAQNLLNTVSGVAEIILAVGLLFASTRQTSAHLIIAMLIVFFSVHIAHLFQPPKMAQGKEWFLYVRIVLQFVLIYWAWCVSKY